MKQAVAYSEESERLTIRSPHSGDLIGEVAITSEQDVHSTIATAEQVFQNTAKAMTPYDRFKLLLGVRDILAANAEMFAASITDEIGKVWQESVVEVQRALITLELCAEEAKRIYGEVYPCDVTANRTGKVAHVERVPLGVVGAIAPYNFPLNTVLHKIAPALAAGNTVVLKPSPKSPLTAELLLSVFKDAGMPDGLLSLVHGDVSQAQCIAKDERVRIVTFTGSVRAGEEMARACGLKKMNFELGGNDPLIVFEDADIDAAASIAVEHGIGSAGQRCTGVKRVLAAMPIVNRLADAVCEKVDALTIGDPSNPTVQFGPMISAEAAQRVDERVSEAVAAGATVLRRGHREAALLPPVVLRDVPETAALVRTETFGPVLPIASFDSTDECVRLVNSTDYGLQAGIFTNDLQLSRRLYRELDVGAVVVNGGPGFRIESIPFGGVKKSGLGREGVVCAVREMTEEKCLIF